MVFIKFSKWIIPQFLLFFLLDLEGKLIIAFISIILHEFCHFFIAKKLGSHMVNFKVHPLGATLEIDDYEGLEINDEIFICLAGPVFNIVVAGISMVLFLVFSDMFFKNIFEVNIVLGMMNLLPAHPLDGAKIVRAILSKRMMYKYAHKIVMYLSFFVGISISILGLLLIKQNFMNINLIVIGAFIIYTTYSASERTMYVVLDQIVKKNKRFVDVKYIENRDISVYYKEDLLKLLSMIERNKFNTFYVLNEKMEFLYELREDEVVEVLKIKGNMTLEDYYDKYMS
ncbi:MAG: site-2 protease family protein [Sarcina sp.]